MYQLCASSSAFVLCSHVDGWVLAVEAKGRVFVTVSPHATAQSQ